MNIDLIIFSTFLVINLVVGLFYSRGVKTINEYALGDRNFSTAAISATIIASWLCGGFFSYTLAETYRQGLYFLVPALGDSLGIIFVGYVYVPRMKEFLGKLSVAEAMGDLFGNKVKLVTVVMGIVLSMGALSIQFKIAAKILELIFGASGIYATLLSAVIIILYSTFGGIKAVTFTDVIQFITFAFVVPIIAIVIWRTLDDHTLVQHTLSTNPVFDYKKVFDYTNPKFYQMLCMIVVFIPQITPMLFQRIAMAKNITQSINSFKIAGIILFVMQMLMVGIGILILADNPGLDPNDLIVYIINHYTYTGFKGVFAVGLMALIMSTADSLINSMSVIFAHDFCKPLGFRWSNNELLVSKLFALFIGCLGVFFALKLSSILDLLVHVYGMYMTVVTVPFLFALFGFRSSGKSVLIGMGAGMSALILATVFPIENVDNYIPGVITNIIALFCSHYLLKQPGGWVGIKDDGSLVNRQNQNKRNWKKIVNQILNFNFITFCQNNAPIKNGTYSYFGFFSITCSLVSMFCMPVDLRNKYWYMIAPIYQSVFLFSSVLLTYPLWSQKFNTRSFISVIWFLGLLYILVLVPSFLLIVSNLALVQFMIFFASIILISVIFPWRIALTMVLLGCASSFVLAQNYVALDANISYLEMQLIFSILLFSSLLIAFLKPKQEDYERAGKLFLDANIRIQDMSQEMLSLLTMKQEFINNINHEIRTPMHHIGSGAFALYKDWDRYSNDQRKDFAEVVYKGYQSASQYMNDMLDLSDLSVNKIDLNMHRHDFVEIVETVLQRFKELYLDNENIEINLNVELNDSLVICDREKIDRVIINLLKNAAKYTEQGAVNITISNADFEYQDQFIRGVKFTIQDTGIGIPENELVRIFGPFIQSSYTKKMSGGRGLGLTLCEKIVTIHGGKIWALNNKDIPGATFEFVIPLFH